VTLSEYISDVSEGTFETEVILRSHEVPVVADFWAVWCAPCRVLGPTLERLAIEAGGLFRLAKVNVDENPNLAVRYGVRGIPAVKAFRNGEVVTEFVGAQPEAIIRRFIHNLAPSEADRAVEQARSLLATRHWAEAERAFRDVMAGDDSSAAAALGLVKSLMMQGTGQEALEILGNFPPGNETVAAEGLRPLAELLAEVEKGGEAPEDDPLAAGFYQAGRLIARGNLPAAMDGLLETLRQDKRYRGGQVKKVLLALFALLGDDDPLTRQYREELASVLF
jgi:putative thioredoxin